MFDTVRVLSLVELETLRRSAAMAPLTTADVQAVIDQAIRLQRDRARMNHLLANLPTHVGALRATLNELHRLSAAG